MFSFSYFMSNRLSWILPNTCKIRLNSHHIGLSNDWCNSTIHTVFIYIWSLNLILISSCRIGVAGTDQIQWKELAIADVQEMCGFHCEIFFRISFLTMASFHFLPEERVKLHRLRCITKTKSQWSSIGSFNRILTKNVEWWNFNVQK